MIPIRQISIRQETRHDAAARESLLDAAYGPVRFAKTSEQLRKDRMPADGLSFVAMDGDRVVGTLRLWPVSAGPACPALLLGPLAVHPDWRKRGIGASLMERALRDARRRGHEAVLLVGDAPYYERFGFTAEKTAGLWMPGPYEQHRLLGHELAANALDGARGLIRVPQKPASRRAPLVAAVGRRPAIPRAA